MPFYHRDDGRELFYVDEGKKTGQPIIFLHGALGDSRSHWGNQLQYSKLQDNYRLIAPDLRGYGKSTPTKWGEVLKLVDLIEDIHFLVCNELKLQNKAIFIGYSVGATLAIDYTIKYSEQVQGLLLLSPLPFFTPSFRTLPFLSKEKRKQSRIRSFTWDLVKRYQKNRLSNFLKKGSKKHPELLQRLESLKNIPTLMIYALSDTVTPYLAFELLEKYTPGIKVIKFEGDHGISHERADEFNKVLLDFVMSPMEIQEQTIPLIKN